MFDRYEDVQDRLDRALLLREEPPSHQRAREQLAKAGIKVKKVIRVYPDAILFVNEAGVVVTAWSEVKPDKPEKVTFYCQTGMPAESFETG